MNYITCPRCQHVTGLAQVTTEKIFCSKCGQKMRVRSPQSSQQQQTLPRKTTARPKPIYTGAIPERDTVARPKSYDFDEDFGGQTQEVSLLEDDFEIDYTVAKKSTFAKLMQVQFLLLSIVFGASLTMLDLKYTVATGSLDPRYAILASLAITLLAAAYLLMPTLIAYLCDKKGRDDVVLLWFVSIILTPIFQLIILMVVYFIDPEQGGAKRRY